MDQENMEQTPMEEEKYVPRPAFQIWGARIGLVLFLLLLVVYYLTYFRGGA